ncbi:MAG: glutamine amidotransferase-related protein [Myxococcota bacterium]
MDRRPLSIAIMQTGETLPELLLRSGGFFGMFTAALTAQGAEVETVSVDVTAKSEHDPAIDIERFDGVIFTGSPSMVAEDTSWMRWGVRTMQQAVQLQVPLLGVCFGHQLLGVAMGADVGPNPRGREIGSVEVVRHDTRPDPLFDEQPLRFIAQVSHVDVIRAPGPRLEVLARTRHDDAHIVRAGPWAWGVQFHPEFDVDTVRAYLNARRVFVDQTHGAGATEARLESLAPSPDAAALLPRFIEVCHQRREQRQHTRGGLTYVS